MGLQTLPLWPMSSAWLLPGALPRVDVWGEPGTWVESSDISSWLSVPIGSQSVEVSRAAQGSTCRSPSASTVNAI